MNFGIIFSLSFFTIIKVSGNWGCQSSKKKKGCKKSIKEAILNTFVRGMIHWQSSTPLGC